MVQTQVKGNTTLLPGSPSTRGPDFYPPTLDTISYHFLVIHPFKPHRFPYCPSDMPGLVSASVLLHMPGFSSPRYLHGSLPLDPSLPPGVSSDIIEAPVIEAPLLVFLYNMGTHGSPTNIFLLPLPCVILHSTHHLKCYIFT